VIDVSEAGDDDDRQEEVESFVGVVDNHLLVIADKVADGGEDYDPDAGA